MWQSSTASLKLTLEMQTGSNASQFAQIKNILNKTSDALGIAVITLNLRYSYIPLVATLAQEQDWLLKQSLKVSF